MFECGYGGGCVWILRVELSCVGIVDFFFDVWVWEWWCVGVGCGFDVGS